MSGIIFQDEMRRIFYLVNKLTRNGRLDRGDWNFLLNSLLVIYGLGSLIAGSLLVRADSYREIMIALVVFSPFFFALFLLKSFREFLVQRSKFRTVGTMALVSIGFALVSLGGAGYVDFFNALAASSNVYIAEGKIKKLEPRRRGSPRVYLEDGRSTIDNIPITDEEYERLRVGDYYVSNMRLGGLGLYYRWRIDSWNRDWEEKARQSKGTAIDKSH